MSVDASSTDAAATGAVPVGSLSAESPGGAAATARRDRTAITLLLISVFVVFLNETMMSVAVSRIMDDLGISASAGQWLTTAFALTMAVVIPITGFLLQRLATRPVFLLGMSLFSLGTLVAAISPTFAVLVTGRVVQASGTAIMLPLLMTTVLTLVPPERRGRIMGRISIVISVAPAVGPTLSGIVLEFAPWRTLFWIMLPLGILALVVGALRVPNVSEPRRVPLDVLSVILAAIGFGSLVWGLSLMGEAAEGLAVLPPWLPVSIGLVTLAVFVLRQIRLQRDDRALLDLRTFQSTAFAQAVALLSISMIALFGTVIVLPLYLQRVLGYETAVTGLALLPGGLLMGLLGPTVGRLYDRYGPRPLVIPGAVLLSIVFWSFTLVDETTPLALVIIGYLGMTLGLAFLFTPLFTAGLGALPPRFYSHGSATIGTMQQVAGAAGTAVFVALLAIGTTLAGGADTETATAAQLAAGVHLAFLAGAIVSLGAVAVALFVRRTPQTVAPGSPAADDESHSSVEAADRP